VITSGSISFKDTRYDCKNSKYTRFARWLDTKRSEFVFDEMYGSLDTDDVVSFDVDGREINPYINEDVLKDSFMGATANLETDVIMEYADEAMSDIGVI
jgi:hypothetical protein